MQKHKGVKRILKAFIYSMQGFKAAFISESAFRQELFLLIILTPVAFYFASSLKEFIFLEIPLLFILIVELLNSFILDLQKVGLHPCFFGATPKLIQKERKTAADP